MNTASSPTRLSQLQGIDLTKYIMAYGVVAIHVGTVYGHFSWPLEWFISLAVPFFFLSSGYLLMRKLGTVNGTEVRRAMLSARAAQIFRLFASWLLIYLPIACTVLYWGGSNVPKAIAQLLCNIIFLGEMPYAWPLWFLYSLGIFTFTLSRTIGSSRGVRLLVVVSTLSYIAFRAISYSDLSGLPHFAVTALNIMPFRVLGVGLYLLCGMLCFKAMQRLSHGPLPYIMIATSITMYYASLPGSELIGGTGLFLAALRLPVHNSARLCSGLRAQSMWIYYLHMVFIFAAKFILGIDAANHWIVLAATAAASCLSAIALSHLQNKPRFSFLARLVR